MCLPRHKDGQKKILTLAAFLQTFAKSLQTFFRMPQKTVSRKSNKTTKKSNLSEGLCERDWEPGFTLSCIKCYHLYENLGIQNFHGKSSFLYLLGK